MPIDVLAKPTLAEPAIYKCFGCKKILKTKELLDKHTHVHDRHIIHGLNVQFVMPCFLQWCFWINTSYLNTKKTWRLFKTSYKISISKLKIVSLAVEILLSKLSCLTVKNCHLYIYQILSSYYTIAMFKLNHFMIKIISFFCSSDT